MLQGTVSAKTKTVNASIRMDVASMSTKTDGDDTKWELMASARMGAVIAPGGFF